MADVNANMKVVLGVEDQTKGAFENLGARMKTLEGSTGKLSGAFTTLGIAGAAIFAASKAWTFFMEGVQKFQAESEIVNLMSERLKSIGVNSEEAYPQIKKFADSMEQLGQQAEMVYEGVGKLSLKTKDLGSAIDLTKTAADLSASGYGTLADNTERLYRIMTGGRGAVSAMREYGIVMTGAHSSAEMLDAVTTKINRTTVNWSQTTQGQIAIAQNNWENLQKQVGAFGTFMEVEMVNSFNTFFSKTLGMGVDWGKGMASMFDDLIFGIQNVGPLLMERASKLLFGDDYEVANNANKDFYDRLLENKNNFEQKWKVVTGIETGKGALGNLIPSDLSDELEKEASRIESAFTDIAKTAVASFQDQQKAINDLKKSITDLDTQLQSDLDKADKNYKQDVINAAKAAQEKADAIDKQIADEKSTMSNGWRTRIADLEAQKAKELDIVARAGGQVSNLSSEMAKDDLTVLEEKHQAEINDLQNTANEKKKIANDEINQRLQYIIEAYTKMQAPGFFDTATSKDETFLRSIGAGTTQNVFNFNQMVAGDDGVKKLITAVIDQLNRTATVKNFGGQ